MQSLASDCGYVNLSKYFGKPYDQQDIGWCYAFSASDLLTYKNRKVLNGQAISPLHMALLQNLNAAEKMSADSGSVTTAIRMATYPFDESNTSAFFKGVCLATVDKELIDPNATIGLRKQFTQLSHLKTVYDSSVAKHGGKLFVDFYSKIFLVNPLVYKIDIVSLQSILRDSRPTEVGLKYLDRFCPYSGRFKSHTSESPLFFYVGGEINHVPQKGPTVTTKITDPKQILEMVHAQLDIENVSSINYYPDFMRRGGFENNHTDRHASTVVGREKVGNVCHIIIRNSWGGCKNKKGEYLYSPHVSKCEDGYLWVPESKLAKHLEGITFLKN
tara:strand:+ start:14859 stop:15848 length:990 start_codon:yes stop_codon:yes gene_type:complete